MRAYIYLYATTYLREGTGICPNASLGECYRMCVMGHDD